MEHTIYLVTAIVGCTLLLLQVILQVFGLGAEADMDAAAPDVDVDVDAGHDPAHGTAGTVFFGILSFKAMVSFAGVFGLTGLSLESTDLAMGHRIAISVLAGFVAMIVVAYMMRALHSLSTSGTLVLRNAVGHQGSVYLRVPPKGKGQGKVTIELQGRSVELPAVTDGGEEIPTGHSIKVVEVLGNETVKVVAV